MLDEDIAEELALWIFVSEYEETFDGREEYRKSIEKNQKQKEKEEVKQKEKEEVKQKEKEEVKQEEKQEEQQEERGRRRRHRRIGSARDALPSVLHDLLIDLHLLKRSLVWPWPSVLHHNVKLKASLLHNLKPSLLQPVHLRRRVQVRASYALDALGAHCVTSSSCKTA